MGSKAHKEHVEAKRASGEVAQEVTYEAPRLVQRAQANEEKYQAKKEARQQ